MSQPKRLALLVYLATARPRGYHSRDTLLGLFWPEADDAAARNALRQALHYLRRSLGEDTVVSRNDRDVGCEAGLVTCDAAAFDDAIAARRYADALELYKGDFLPGFFVEDAPDVERWIDEERESRRRAAVSCAWALADSEAERGELRSAVLWARKAVALMPHDEASLRRLVALLDRDGEPAAAIEAFEDFERRQLSEYGITPSAETVDLIAGIRNRKVDASTRRWEHAGTPTSVPMLTPRPAVTSPPAPRPAVNSLPGPAADASPAVRSSAFARWAIAASMGLVLMTGAWYATSNRKSPVESAEVSARAIAVLPFVNMSGDEDNEYFSDGITEEILNALAHVEGLRIASRTSSFAFKDKQDDVRDIGRKLGVAAVLEGSVRRSGNRVKITAQLVSVSDGYHLWSHTYDRQVNDIFEVQEEIAHAITDALALRFSEAQEAEHRLRATRDPEAYDLYLRGRYLISIRSQERNEQAIEFFNQATARDPRFAGAYAGLAMAQIAMAEYQPPREVLPLAKAAALRALQLDSTLVETRLALSEVRQVYDRDWQAAESEIERALALNPSSADAHAAYAGYLLDARRFDEARKERQHTWKLRAAQAPDTTLNTFRMDRHISWASFEWYVGNYREAMSNAQAAVQLDPSNVLAHVLVGMLHIDMGQPDAAVREMEKVRDLTNNGLGNMAQLGRAYAAAGRHAEARALLDTLHNRSRTQYIPKDQIALLHYALGDTTAALQWLERAVDDYHWWMPNSNYHPLWKGLHDHARFRALMKRIGAPD